jgi:hypothetical protein
MAQHEMNVSRNDALWTAPVLRSQATGTIHRMHPCCALVSKHSAQDCCLYFTDFFGLLVDPSIQSLNTITENMDKIEALSVEIASILEEAGSRSKLLVSKDESPWLPIETAENGLHSPRKHAVRRKRAKASKKRSRKGAKNSGDAKPVTADPAPEFLPVSPRLFYRYDREELYRKVWEMPLDQVAKQYGLSFDTFRKTCERLWIPIPRRAHWTKKAANEPVAPPPPLPAVKVARPKKKGAGPEA